MRQAIELKIISWNLNGLLSCINHKSFLPIMTKNPDIICLQEIRTKEEPVIINNYKHIWNHAERDKYSGTAVIAVKFPNEILRGFGDNVDPEGRLITLEYEKFYLINAYVPNSQANLKRKAYRLNWDYDFQEYVQGLMEEKSVIICGDFNVTRSRMDFFEENQRAMWAEEGLISDERANLETLLSFGLLDVFRELNPEKRSYTWWSNRLDRRSLNRGWRLDYFLVSEELKDNIINIEHLTDIEGSDHCPILLEVSI